MGSLCDLSWEGQEKLSVDLLCSSVQAGFWGGGKR